MPDPLYLLIDQARDAARRLRAVVPSVENWRNGGTPAVREITAVAQDLDATATRLDDRPALRTAAAETGGAL